MDRRKFIKGSAAAAALAGAALTVPACDEAGFLPFIHGRGGRKSGRGSEVTKSASLFTASDRHEMGSGNNLRALIKKSVEEAEVKPDVVLLGGDYVGGGKEMTPEFAINSLYEEVYASLEPATSDVMFTYGSHDNCCTDGYSAFFSGPHRCDGYYIYGISYLQMAAATDAAADAALALRKQLLSSGAPVSEFDDDDIILAAAGYSGIDAADRYGKSAQAASENFLKWIDSLEDNAPIVVMSHMPLHYNRGDNLGGLVWYEALAKAAKTHDVIFLWGHNHTLEEKAADTSDRTDEKLKDRFDYLLTPADLLTPGDTIEIQGASKGKTEKKTIEFIYANAGYVKLGYGTVITFESTNRAGTYDSVTFHRYAVDDVDPETEIGFTGKSNPYTVDLQKA